METFTYRVCIVELTVIGDTRTDQLMLECWDMSPDGGLWFTLCRGAHDVLELLPTERPVPIDLLERVATIAGVELTAQ